MPPRKKTINPKPKAPADPKPKAPADPKPKAPADPKPRSDFGRLLERIRTSGSALAFARVVTTAIAALADGRLTDREIDTLFDALSEAMKVFARGRAKARREEREHDELEAAVARRAHEIAQERTGSPRGAHAFVDAARQQILAERATS